MKHLLRLVARHLPLGCICLGLPMLCISCATHTDNVTDVQTVRVYPPNSDGGEIRTHGFLVVNTPTQTYYNYAQKLFMHTGYTIYDARTHKILRYVPNHAGPQGVEATLVLLPAGDYMVEAATVYHQPIRFPVIIRPETQTTVCLEPSYPAPKTMKGEFYALEMHGHPIGWIAEARTD